MYEVEYNYERFQRKDYNTRLQRVGGINVTEFDIRNRLKGTHVILRYQVVTEEEITIVLVGDRRETEDNEDDEPLLKNPILL